MDQYSANNHNHPARSNWNDYKYNGTPKHTNRLFYSKRSSDDNDATRQKSSNDDNVAGPLYTCFYINDSAGQKSSNDDNVTRAFYTCFYINDAKRSNTSNNNDKDVSKTNSKY